MKKVLKIFAPLFLISSAIALPLVLTSCASTEKVWSSDDFKVDGYNLVDDPDEYYTEKFSNGLRNIDLENNVISYWCHSQASGENSSSSEMSLLLTTNPASMMDTYYQYYCHSSNKKPNSNKYIFTEYTRRFFNITLVDFHTQDNYFSSQPFCQLAGTSEFNFCTWEKDRINIGFWPTLKEDRNTSFATVGDWVTYKISFLDPFKPIEPIFSQQIKIVAVEQ